MGGEADLRRRGGLPLAVFLFLLAPATTWAQGVSTSLAASPSAVTLPSPGIGDFMTGWIQHQGTIELNVRVPGGKDWTVFVRCDDPDLGGGKDVGDLLWRLNGAGGWNSVTPGELPAVSGTGASLEYIEIAIALDEATDPPATYDGTLVFRLERY